MKTKAAWEERQINSKRLMQILDDLQVKPVAYNDIGAATIWYAEGWHAGEGWRCFWAIEHDGHPVGQAFFVPTQWTPDQRMDHAMTCALRVLSDYAESPHIWAKRHGKVI